MSDKELLERVVNCLNARIQSYHFLYGSVFMALVFVVMTMWYLADGVTTGVLGVIMYGISAFLFVVGMLYFTYEWLKWAGREREYCKEFYAKEVVGGG